MGSGFWFGLLFLVLHLALCGALWLLARSRALEVEGYFLPVALLVPVWGPLCVVLLHTSHRLTGGQLLDQTLKKLRINEEIYKNILVVENEEKDTVVPLEEALLVNSPAQKRKLILSVLTDDPAGYYDLLQQARMDDDSEVVHYASTALAQISKEADLKLQQQEQRYAAAPGDAKVLEEYCDYLESYLDGGFVQGKAAEIQRHQLEQLLKKRLDALGTPQLHAGMQAGSSPAGPCRVRPGRGHAGRADGPLAPAGNALAAPPADGGCPAGWCGHPENTA